MFLALHHSVCTYLLYTTSYRPIALVAEVAACVRAGTSTWLNLHFTLCYLTARSGSSA